MAELYWGELESGGGFQVGVLISLQISALLSQHYERIIVYDTAGSPPHPRGGLHYTSTPGRMRYDGVGIETQRLCVSALCSLSEFLLDTTLLYLSVCLSLAYTHRPSSSHSHSRTSNHTAGDKVALPHPPTAEQLCITVDGWAQYW